MKEAGVFPPCAAINEGCHDVSISSDVDHCGVLESNGRLHKPEKLILAYIIKP